MSGAGRSPGLPGVNVTVHLRLPELDREVSSRVEGTEAAPDPGGQGTYLLVAAPRVEGSLAWERQGAGVEVRWATARGQCLVRCELDRRIPGRLPLWRLRPVAAPVVDQRRRYARAPVPVTARLQLPPSQATAPAPGSVAPEGAAPGSEAAAPAVLDARLRDLSERGARLELPPAPTRNDDPPTAAGDAVVVEVELGSGPLRLAGTVLRTTTEPDGRVVVVVELDPDEAAAETIRKAVLEAQIEARGLPAR